MSTHPILHERARYQLNIEHLWVVIILSVVLARAFRFYIHPSDFYWHIAAGRDMVRSGGIPQVDTYSFVAHGTPYTGYQQVWLSELTLYIIHQLGGPLLTWLFGGLINIITHVLILTTLQRIVGCLRAAAIGAGFCFAMGLGNWEFRPQYLGFLWCALLIALHAQFVRHRSSWCLAGIAAIMALWVNSHGSFVLGLAYVGLWWATELFSWWQSDKPCTAASFRQIMGQPSLLVGCALAGALASPFGLGVFTHVISIQQSNVVMDLLWEWQPVRFGKEWSHFVVGVVAMAVLLARSPERAHPFELALFVVFALFGFRYVRGAVWFGFFLAPTVARHARALMRVRGIVPAGATAAGLPWVNRLLAVAIVAAAPLSYAARGGGPLERLNDFHVLADDTPVGATNYLLNNGLSPNVFSDMEFASYLIWAAAPSYRVFFDTRCELYNDTIARSYMTIARGECGWDDELAKYGIDTMMVSTTRRAQLIQSALASGWQERYRDAAAVVLIRRDVVGTNHWR